MNRSARLLHRSRMLSVAFNGDGSFLAVGAVKPAD
jgi:hypothetical protein